MSQLPLIVTMLGALWGWGAPVTAPLRDGNFLDVIDKSAGAEVVLERGVAANAKAADEQADMDTVARVFRAHLGQVKRCYEVELVKNPALVGRAGLVFEIGQDGKVGKAWLESSTLNSPTAEACIVAAARGLVFPKLTVETTEASFPLVFQSGPAPRAEQR